MSSRVLQCVFQSCLRATDIELGSRRILSVCRKSVRDNPVFFVFLFFGVFSLLQLGALQFGVDC